jgi:hypothetical protein
MSPLAHVLLIDTHLGDIIRLLSRGRMLAYPKEEATNTHSDAWRAKLPSETPSCANHGDSILASSVMQSAGIRVSANPLPYMNNSD